MVKRLFIFIMLGLMGSMFWQVANQYEEHETLSKLGSYYAKKGPSELGAANLVTSVVVTYRGLDTLGEVTVLFLAAAAIGLLLKPDSKPDEETPALEHRQASEIVTTATELLLPMVILLGVYVFTNGHLSPGGGFQGGAIIASGTMFLILALPETHISRVVISWVESLSGFSYVVVGALGILLAGGFLDNRLLPLGEFGGLLSAGAIPLIYVFVGLKVGFELSAILDRFRKQD